MLDTTPADDSTVPRDDASPDAPRPSTPPVAIDVLVAVHHPVRRRLLDHLTLDGPATVGTLARQLGLAVGSASHHLRMLERAGVVERAPELRTDGRTSWWRTTGTRLTWSVDDFADQPADRHRALAVERLDAERSVRKLAEWHRERATAPAALREAATSIDWSVRATPAQLQDLGLRFLALIDEWTDEVRAARPAGPAGPPADGTIPVHGFVRVFPSRP